jgi:hypothetical protein
LWTRYLVHTSHDLSRQNLKKICLAYICPIFEYAREIWDNCGVCYSTKLEKLQLDAARIVIGLPIFTKIVKLYSETGWTTFSSRRHNRKSQITQNVSRNIFIMVPENLILFLLNFVTRIPF